MDHEAAQLEKQHVHDVYESTAPYFSDLQSKAWPRVRQFLQEQKPGSLIADIGCGTGKYLKVNSQVYTLGCDYCGPLVEIARSRGCEVMVCDNLQLPFRDQGLDAIISIGEQCHSQRSHSLDYEPLMARMCCADISKGGEEENGFSNTLGKSFRSWFFSRSLDESTLRKQIERVRPLKNTDGWAHSTISIQPSPHASLDSGPQEPFSTREQNLDEDVFVEMSQKQLEWPRAPATVKHLCGDQPGEVRRNGDGNFLEGTNTSENGMNAGDVEEGPPSASRILRRISALDSTDSNPEETISVEDQQPNVLDSGAFMRYYHVFREGELYGLLKEHVAELHVLSSGNDHGNWCIIAEKKDNCD
ncbi:hypothetical protein GH733_005510 [Mirounga leonina]|nr:hypothetical protein GH733_005510 [Mirounga leonina]